jgi:DNA polymerase-1
MSSYSFGNQNGSTQKESVDYEVIRTNEGIKRAAEYLADSFVLGVDTENTGLDPYCKDELLFQIGNSEKCFVIDTFIGGLDLTPIKEIMEDVRYIKVLHNAKYDYKWLLVKYGIRMKNMHCTMIAERLLTVGKTGVPPMTSLAYVVNKYLGIEMSKKARSGFIDRDPILNPITAAEYLYSAKDVVLLPDIYYQQALQRDIEELVGVFNLEMRAIRPFAEMELAGCTLDVPRWKTTIEKAEKVQKELQREIFSCFSTVITQTNLFGLPPFNLGSPQQLLSNLNKLGAALPKKKGFKVTDTKEETLSKNKDKHVVFELLVRLRGYQKIVTSYGDSILSKINEKTGRLHANFNQVRAETGRCSSSKPNLQQVPGHDEDDEDSLDFRSCFICPPGRKLITADYSQQELRILADLSADKTFYKAYTEKDKDGNELDVHRYTAHQVFNTPYEEVTDAQRKKAKTLNFFLVFGGGAFALAAKLKIPEEEAQSIIDDYFKRYSDIKKFLDVSGNSALNKGYSLTKVIGRKRYIQLPSRDDPKFDKIKKAQRRKGMNTPIQGSGADVTKLAMVYLNEALAGKGLDAQLIMVIHDEFVVECCEKQSKEVASTVEECMIKGFSDIYTTIPMRVDANVGDVWAK